jgi:phosphoribosylaminoimidazolecarboxamide formyltransferase/IMP cyclohydrolase
MIQRALLSVSDKTGLIDFARALADQGVELLSTGGTAKAIRDAGVPVKDVSEFTGFPEMLDGRVKTLHPRVHAGILSVRDNPAHAATMAEHGLGYIDLVCVNLYPFAQTVSRPHTLEDAIENIDIGGPAMVRSSAKNYKHVAIVTDPADYAGLVAEMRANGGELGDATRFKLAKKAFTHTAQYDGHISNYLTSLNEAGERDAFGEKLTLQFSRAQTCRYGENPHQNGAFYVEANAPAGTIASARQIQGKELSYNNIADTDAALECVKLFDAAPSCVIVKHANPCGVAVRRQPAGGLQPGLPDRPGIRLRRHHRLQRPPGRRDGQDHRRAPVRGSHHRPRGEPGSQRSRGRQEERAPAGMRPLVRTCHPGGHEAGGRRPAGAGRGHPAPWRAQGGHQRAPSEKEMEDLLFAWRVAKFVKSNAIVYARDRMTIGVGAGQMSRVNSARIAAIKAEHAGLAVPGSVMASDAFFPFRDGLDNAAAAGITAVIQPGGSMRDDEVIAAANEHGIAMVFTGVRHFRH